MSDRSSCSFEGCEKPWVGRGLCGGHYTQWSKGDVLRPLRRRIVTDDLRERLRFYAPPGAPLECWEWTGSRNKDYGVFSVHNSVVRVAHVVAWELHHGRSLPHGMVVRHSCDNPPCCNPAHLLLGTHANNMEDKVERGRQSKGSAHGISKLVEEDIPRIRAMYKAGSFQKDIAREFGVSQTAISHIILGKNWAWLEG